jgi:hypothetical protein
MGYETTKDVELKILDQEDIYELVAPILYLRSE